jgi:hypothetical protein
MFNSFHSRSAFSINDEMIPPKNKLYMDAESKLCSITQSPNLCSHWNTKHSSTYLIDHTTDALLSVADGLAATFGLFDRLHHLLFLLGQILPLSGTSRLFTNLDG